MKPYCIISLLLLPLSFGGCYDDKGNYSYRENIGEALIVSIPGVTDRNNSFVCLENETVKLVPELQLAEGTTEADYDFEWSRYYKMPQGEYGHYVQPEVISTSRNLEYTISETPEDYWAVFKVTNRESGATSQQKFSFVISPLNGWAVLTGDADGADISFIWDEDVVPGGGGKVVRDHFSAMNGSKMQGVSFLANCPNGNRKYMYAFGAGGNYVIDPDTYKWKQEVTYSSLFNRMLDYPTVPAPEAYGYSPENNGFEVIVDGGKVYYIAYMMVWGKAESAPVSCQGITSYHAAPMLASITNAGNNPGSRFVFFDTEGNRFLLVKMWGDFMAPHVESEFFNPGEIGPEYSFVFLGEGRDGSTAAIFNRQLDDGSLAPYLFQVDFKSSTPVPLGCTDISSLEGISEATDYAFGLRGDFMFYASGSKVYLYRYGRSSSSPVLELAAGEQVVQMKMYSNPKDDANHGKVLFIATETGNSGKVYKLKFNEMNGVSNAAPVEYSGFGRIVDMALKI